MQFKLFVSGKILNDNFKIIIFKNNEKGEVEDMILEENFFFGKHFL